MSPDQAQTKVEFAQDGMYVFRLTSDDTEFTRSDEVTITVTGLGNQPPDVEAGENQVVELDSAASSVSTTLHGVASDDGLPLGSTVTVTWTQLNGPVPATITGPANTQTTVNFSVTGLYVFRLTASDGNIANFDDVSVLIIPSGAQNQPPVVEAGPDATVDVNDTFTLNGAVSDDGLPNLTLQVNWSQVSGPAEGIANFVDPTSAVTAVAFTHAGQYILRLTGDDTALVAFDQVTVTVSDTSNTAPQVSAIAPASILLPNEAALQSTVSDDGLPDGILNIQWTQVSGPTLPTGGTGTATFHVQNNVTFASFSDPGDYVLRLTANDGQLTGTVDVPITVFEDTPGPLVEITSPADTDIITAPTPVIGTISSTILDTYALQLRLKTAGDAGAWTTIASGSTPITNAQLGEIDPTLSLNGIYELRLTATDQVGRTATTDLVTIVFDKNMKVGNFTVSFEDLNIPVAGLPIQIVRTYDSRDKRQGDFGVGWSLSVKDVRLQKNRNFGLNWEQTSSGGLFPIYSMQRPNRLVVTITFPDNEVFQFEAKFNPASQFGIPISAGTFAFVPLSGTHGTLAIVGDDNPSVAGSVPGPVDLFSLSTGDVFNPTRFQFTSQEGIVFIIDENDGLQSITDRNSNTITFTPNGIIHSAGKSILFNRDAEGRIASITDPNGNELLYTYDANGDLVTFTDRESNTTAFTYDGSHLLLDIVAPRGVRAVRNEYDADNRLIKQTDAEDNVMEFTHDLAVRREIIKDRLGNETIHEYDLNGNIVSTTDPLGNVTTRTYDANDNETSVTDALGNTTTNTYDVQDNLLTETDQLGNTTSFTYDPFRNPLTITDPRGNVTKFAYDGSGNLIRQTDPLGNTTDFTYDAQGNLLTTTDALGNVTENQYDSAGNVTQTIVKIAPNAILRESTFIYDSNGNQITQTVKPTGPNGAELLTTTFEYDAENRLVQTTFPDGTFAQTTYNSIGKAATTIDQLGRVTSFAYDDRGNLISTTFPDGTIEETAYDAENRRIASIDQVGRVTTFTYDALGRLTKTTFPDGAMTSTVYDGVGRLTSTMEANGNPMFFAYDASGRRTKVTDALGNETTFTYDGNGNQLSMTDTNGHTTTFTYDANNRLTVTTFHDGTTRVTTYDALNRRIAETDQASHTTSFGYDGLGRLTSVTNALGLVTTYTYNEQGQMLSQTDANNHTTRFEYDQLNRRTKRMLAAGQFETMTYDAVGNLASKTDFNGCTTTYTYDDLNRLLSKTPDLMCFSQGIATIFTYTATGQCATMTDASGVTLYRIYDLRDRLLEKVTPQGTLTYTYDTNGNVLSIQSSNLNGTDMTYEYDALNHLMAVTDTNGRTAYTSDDVGNLESFTYPNDVSHNYTYDELNRLTNLVIQHPTLGPLNSYAYTLGPAGNRLSVSELSGRTVNYAYDNIYRLTKEIIAGAIVVGTVDYTHDDVGNRFTRTSTMPDISNQTFSYDSNDRLTRDTYDHNGNTTNGTVVDPITNNEQQVTDRYDFENRLIERTNPDGTVITIVYNGDGNRVRKTITPFTGDSTTILYLVDDLNLTGFSQVLEEQLTINNQQLTVTTLYIYGLDLISQDQVIDVGNGPEFLVSFYGYDGQMNVRFLTNANGNVTDTYDYDAFGNLIAQTGITPNDYLYTGEQFDFDLGLYYLRARYNNTDTGRFWTIDTFEGILQDPISLHKYLYSKANPIINIDPSGNQSLTLAETQITNAIIGFVAGFVVTATIRILSHTIRSIKCDTVDFSDLDLSDVLLQATIYGGVTALFFTIGTEKAGAEAIKLGRDIFLITGATSEKILATAGGRLILATFGTVEASYIPLSGGAIYGFFASCPE